MMGLKSILVVLGLTLYVLANSAPTKHCGTPTLSDEEKRANHEREEIHRKRLSERDPNAKRDTIWVAFNWHHIYYGTPYLDVRALDLYVNISNEFYKNTGVQFYTGSLDSFDAQLNSKPNWWNLVYGSTDDYEMRTALKIGNSRNLNVYLVNLYQWGGVSAFPSSYQYNPIMDGIVLLYRELPVIGGDPTYVFVENMLFTHEVGHWMGLYHTFDGGCTDEYGDYVLDTPAEYEPHYDCPANPIDSCPSLPGLDPVHNIMDYAAWCRNHFTQGQIDRMIVQFNAYRNDPIVNQTAPLTTGFSTPVTTNSNGCSIPGSMRCSSATNFQQCSNGQWSNNIPCGAGTYCTPNGNYIYCGYTNPSTTTTTGPATTARLTTNSVTTQKLTTNNVQGAQLVIESPALYHVSVSTDGARDTWIDYNSYNFGQINNVVISWGPQQGRPFVKEDGQYDDPVDPTITHVWTTLTGINGTNFFPSNEQIPDSPYSQYYRWNGTGNAKWTSQTLLFRSKFIILGTSLKVYDSEGNLRGQGGHSNLNILMDWPESNTTESLYLDTMAPMNYTGNPLNTRVEFELIARRFNNQPITSGAPVFTTKGITSQALTTRALTSQALTTKAVTSQALTTQPIATTRGLTTGSASVTCNVGATRCTGSASQYQTCVYTYGSGGWVGGWGGVQNCAPGTNCVQYGTAPNTYIGCN